MKKKTMVGSMIETGVANIVGVGLITPTATMINALDAGTAKTIASTIPGLQSTALVAKNVEMVNKSMKFDSNKKTKGLFNSKHKKKIW